MNNSTTTNYLAPVEERERNRYANMMLPLFCLTIRYRDVEKGKNKSHCTLTGRCVSKRRGLSLPKYSIYVSIYTFIQKDLHSISIYFISL